MIKGLKLLVKVTQIFCSSVQENTKRAVFQLELVVCFFAGVLEGVAGKVSVKWIKSTDEDKDVIG